MRHVLSFFLLAFGAPALPAATVTPLGEALPAPVVDLFAPPTRADAPWAATADAVFRWENDNRAWVAAYEPPWQDVRIVGLGGYAKSSRVLYVVHGGGVARTADTGASWTEAIPAAFGPERGAFRALVVNPHERKHAVVAFTNGLWETTDYGASYQLLERFPVADPLLGAAFLPLDEAAAPVLLVGTRERLLRFEGASLRPAGRWTPPRPIRAFAAHPVESVLTLALESGPWLQLRLGAGSAFQVAPVAGPANPSLLAPVLAGSSSLWLVRGERLFLGPLGESRPAEALVSTLAAAPVLLRPHPRDPASLYFAGKNNVGRVEDGFAGLSSAVLQPPPSGRWDAAAWELAPAFASAAPAPAEAPMDAAVSLQAILRREPPVSRIIAAVLEFEQHDPAVLGRWRTLARRRHWVPELRLDGGLREYPVDTRELRTVFDRFGVESVEDLSLSDEIRNLGWVRLALTWDLERAVFDEDAIDVQRELRATYEQRREIVEEVTALYYERIGILAELAGTGGSLSAARQLERLIALHRLTALLNGFCGEELLSVDPLGGAAAEQP